MLGLMPAVGGRRLTARQREVLDLMSRPEARTREVAVTLGISQQTVKHHLSAAYRALGVRNLGQAIRVIHAPF